MSFDSVVFLWIMFSTRLREISAEPNFKLWIHILTSKVFLIHIHVRLWAVLKCHRVSPRYEQARRFFALPYQATAYHSQKRHPFDWHRHDLQKYNIINIHPLERNKLLIILCLDNFKGRFYGSKCFEIILRIVWFYFNKIFPWNNPIE